MRARTIKLAAVVTAIGALALAVPGAASAKSVASPYYAGYQANHDTFRWIAASWVVPRVDCNVTSAQAIDPNSYYLVGFGTRDFFGDPTVNQIYEWGFCTGIQDTYGIYVNEGGGGVGLIDQVNAGDSITLAVSYRSGLFHFSYVNHTDGHNWAEAFGCEVSVKCDRSKAIVFGGVNGGPLADYGSVTFHDISIVDAAGHRGTFVRNRHWRTTKFVEHDGPTGSFQVSAAPGPLSQRGSKFTDYWHRF